jgi:glyoxylase-like metal-dependent hydrolase (beta-lactamase superfamily II)
MKTRRLGDMLIHRVVEFDGFPVAGGGIFEGWRPEILEDARGWLDPRLLSPDGSHLLLTFHSFVLQTGGRNILIDTCHGNDKNRAPLDYATGLQGPYLARLAEIGLAPEDIDVVLCTHLHFDHVGWNTRLTDGRWVPTFPKARYVMARADVDYLNTLLPVGVDAAHVAAYHDSVLPVIAAGQADLIDTTGPIAHEIGHGLHLEGAAGHTPGSVLLCTHSGGQDAIFSGDVLHHPVQLADTRLGIHGEYDPVLAKSVRDGLIARLTDTDTLLLAAHFPDPTAGRIVSRRGGFAFAFAEE